MSSLIWKEVRSLLPLFLLMAFLCAASLVIECISHAPDTRPYASSAEDYVFNSGSERVMIFVITFAVASGLLIREYDDRTIEFLDSLPVTRSSLFAAKVIAVMPILAIPALFDLVVCPALHAMSRTSLDPGFHWPILVTSFLLELCQTFVFLSLGLALSFLRRFGWLVIGSLAWVLLLLRENFPGIDIINIMTLTDQRFEGQRWLIPWTKLAIQLPASVILIGAAYALFLGAGDRVMAMFRRLAQTYWGAGLLGATSIGAAILGFSLVAYFFGPEFESEAAEELTVQYPNWSTVRKRTARFDFIYPANLSQRAEKLVSQADGIYDTVTNFLPDDRTDRIVVDLTDVFGWHAGLAHWNKIRIDLTATEGNDELQAVLGHELTHVVLERISNSKLSDDFNSTRFFHEGLASFVEYRYFRQPDELDRLRSVAAVMHARDEVVFEELVDNQKLEELRDLDLVYPLGEVFLFAVVDRFGNAAVGNLARSFAKLNLTDREADGFNRWQEVFQSCGYNLSDAIDSFYAKLDAEAARHEDFVDSLPRIRGSLNETDDYINVEVQWNPIPDWIPICRFREAHDTPARQYIFGETYDNVNFTVWSGYFSAETIWFQVGITDSKGRVIYEPWLEARINKT